MNRTYKVPLVHVETFEGPNSAVFPPRKRADGSLVDPGEETFGRCAEYNSSGLVYPQRNWHWRGTIPDVGSAPTSIAIIVSVHMAAFLGGERVVGRVAVDGAQGELWDSIIFENWFTYEAERYPPEMFLVASEGVNWDTTYAPPLYTRNPMCIEAGTTFGRGGYYYPDPNPPFHLGEHGAPPYIQSPRKDCYLRLFAQDTGRGEVSGPGIEWMPPGWPYALTSGGNVYYGRPFPTTVDAWFAGQTFFFGLDGMGNLTFPNVWAIMDATMYVFAFTPDRPPPPPPLVTGHAKAGPGNAGEIRHRQTHGRSHGVTPPLTPPPNGQHYSVDGLLALAVSVGLPADSAVDAAAIALAESGGDTTSTNVNTDGSVDRGLWQINNAAHPDVSDACAFDPQCNARAMKSISSNGTNWTPWTTYNTGAYLAFVPAAQAAWARMNPSG